MSRRTSASTAGLLLFFSIVMLAGAAPVADDRRNLKVSFKIRNRTLESVGNFIVQQGKQMNYAVGGDQPSEIATSGGKGVEYKKYGAIVNAIVSINSVDGRAEVQVQIERSGPLGPVERLSNVRPIETFQLQTMFSARLGKPVVLVDEPDRHVELLVEEAPL